VQDSSQTWEKANDQIDRLCCLCLSRRNLGAGHITRAALSAGRYDHASRLRLRPVQDARWWCLRGQKHHTPSPQVRPVGRRARLPSVDLLKRLAASKLLFLKGQGPRSGRLSSALATLTLGRNRTSTDLTASLPRAAEPDVGIGDLPRGHSWDPQGHRSGQTL
jgi:hypothetical protein